MKAGRQLWVEWSEIELNVSNPERFTHFNSPAHHLHTKPTKTSANATFNKAYAKVKNGSALGVSVNAIVSQTISICSTQHEKYGMQRREKLVGE